MGEQEPLIAEMLASLKALYQILDRHDCDEEPAMSRVHDEVWEIENARKLIEKAEAALSADQVAKFDGVVWTMGGPAREDDPLVGE
jgi:hypothetical protein